MLDPKNRATFPTVCGWLSQQRTTWIHSFIWSLLTLSLLLSPFLSSSFSSGLPLLFPISGPYRNGSLRVPFSRFTLPSGLDWQWYRRSTFWTLVRPVEIAIVYLRKLQLFRTLLRRPKRVLNCPSSPCLPKRPSLPLRSSASSLSMATQLRP